MKRCPQCGREYDNTMRFCLDDGAELLYGPASGRSEPPASAGGQFVDEPQTAILHETAPPGEAPTRAQIHTTEQTAVFPRGAEAEPRDGLGDASEKHSLSANRAAKPLAALILAVLVLVGGFFGYRYLSSSTKRIESIAVMPFVNETGDANIEYLADGMTETLIRNLSQLPELNVKARASVFRYKGKEFDPKTIGKELGVQAVLIGRFVPRGGEVLHFSLELIDTQTENVIWTNEYDRKPREIILLQNAIARDVSDRLRPLAAETDQRAGKNYTENPEAYRLYLQGRFFWNKRTLDGFRQAIAHFEQALAIDPNFALAYSGLSDSEALLSVYQGANPKDVMPKAKDAALKALALDPDLAEGHASLGQVLQTYDYDFAGAEREFKRAIELNPNYATAHQWYAELLTQLGRFDDAFASIERARALDPFNLVINRENGGLRCYAREYDKCIGLLEKAVALDPNFSGFHYDLSWAYQMKGNYAGSVEAFAKWRELSDDIAGAAAARDSFAKGGWRGFLKAVTDKNSSAQLKPYNIGVYLVALAENEAAISEFEKTYDERINDVYWLSVDPRLDPVRSEPRFQALLKKVNFPK
jgi:TolB-like protein